MSYNIHITKVAELDLYRAADHIEYVLKNPEAAYSLIDKAEAQINSLADFPEKFRLVDDPLLASWGIRFVMVDNYMAFYTVDKIRNLVIIVRFLFQKSDWNAILHKGIPLV